VLLDASAFQPPAGPRLSHSFRMMNPGSSLAVVSLALQVMQGLLHYYELLKDCDDDVKEIQRSLLWLANLFRQLDITLQKPNLQAEIVSIIRMTTKSSEDNMKKL
jgi:hypothetical protein